MLFDFLIERAAGDPETLRGLLNTAMLLMKHSLDVLLFELKERQIGIEKGCAQLCVAVEVKVVEGDVFLITQQNRPFDYVTQLANITGP